MSELDRVLIRVHIEGKWKNLSLQKILDRDYGGQIAHWFYDKIGSLIGLQEGAVVESHHVTDMLKLLKILGVTVYEIKE